MVIRPALTAKLGKPKDEIRDHFLATLKEQLASEKEKLQESTRPARVILRRRRTCGMGRARHQAALTRDHGTGGSP